MHSKSLLDCLQLAVLLFQQMLGWLKSPSRTRPACTWVREVIFLLRHPPLWKTEEFENVCRIRNSLSHRPFFSSDGLHTAILLRPEALHIKCSLEHFYSLLALPSIQTASLQIAGINCKQKLYWSGFVWNFSKCQLQRHYFKTFVLIKTHRRHAYWLSKWLDILQYKIKIWKYHPGKTFKLKHFPVFSYVQVINCIDLWLPHTTLQIRIAMFFEYRF